MVKLFSSTISLIKEDGSMVMGTSMPANGK